MVWAVLFIVVVLVLAAVLAPRLRKPQSPPRACGRVPLEVPVRLRLPGREVELVTADISRGGLCVVGELRTSAGQPVEMHFALPGRSQPLAIHGVVRWVERGRLGLLFDLQDRRSIAVGDWLQAQAVTEPD